MKRKFLLAAVIASFLAFASALGGPAEAQIGIGRSSSELTLSGQLSIANGTAGDPAIIFTSDDDGTGTGIFQSGVANTLSFTFNGIERILLDAQGRIRTGNGTDNQPSFSFTTEIGLGMWRIGAENLGFSVSNLVFDLENTNDAGASANLATISSTLGIMDNSDTVNGLSIELVNADHTGSSNQLNAISIAAITSDAQATEIGLLIGTGWDTSISANASIQAGDGSFNKVGFGFTNEVGSGMWRIGAGNLGFSVGSTGVILDLENPNAAGGSANLATVSATPGIFNGSDTLNALSIEIASVNHTGTGNTLNLISTAAITGDANSNLNAISIGALTGTTGADTPPETEYAINIAGGWDLGISNSSRYADTVQTVTGADGGGRVTVTVTPTTGYVELVCNDLDTGCLLAFSETGAVEGQKLTVVLITLAAGDVTIPDEGGVLNGTATTMTGVDDTLSLVYTGSIWVETSVSIN